MPGKAEAKAWEEENRAVLETGRHACGIIPERQNGVLSQRREDSGGKKRADF